MMIQTEIDIARPPGDVFAFLVDQASWAMVDDALVSFEPHAELARGLTGTFSHRRAGMVAATTWEIVELLPGARLEVRVVGKGYELRETAILALNPLGTHATFIDALRPTSLFGRVFVALSGGFVRRDLQSRAAKAKSLLEGTAPGWPPEPPPVPPL